MKTTTYKIDALQPGQEVAIANCRETGRVVSRIKNGLYLVAWNGREITMPRKQLGVSVRGQWRFGPHNAISA